MGWFDSLCKTEIIGWQDSLCRQSSGSPKQSFPFPSSWRPQSSGNSLSLPIKKTFLFKTHIYLTNFKLDITKCINLKWCFSPKDILKEDNWWKETHFRFDFTPKLSVWRIYLRLQTSRSPNVHHENCKLSSPAALSSAFELDPILKMFRNPLLIGLKKSLMRCLLTKHIWSKICTSMYLKKSLMGLKRLRKKLPKTWASDEEGSRINPISVRRMSPLLLKEDDMRRTLLWLAAWLTNFQNLTKISLFNFQINHTFEVILHFPNSIGTFYVCVWVGWGVANYFFELHI